MDTFEIDVQFYRQIEKFIEQLQSGTEHEENIFLFGTCYFQKEQFYTERGDKHWKPTSPGQMNIR